MGENHRRYGSTFLPNAAPLPPNYRFYFFSILRRSAINGLQLVFSANFIHRPNTLHPTPHTRHPTPVLNQPPP
ncbi:MAG: hypothetical protein KME27_07530 [Lyngbya sp. HA4199-MV5]|nr:hypothetical protein [Lyngbya sp. HA4199-MV5]